MGALFRALSAMADMQNQNKAVKNTRGAIFEIRDRLRNSPQFSNVFYNVLINTKHPPMEIICDYANASFWSIAWDETVGSYEPYSTLKRQDINIGYQEGCAIFLLIQECYPNVYDFPNSTTTDIANQVPISLKMKKGFIGKALAPAVTPKVFEAAEPQKQAQSGSKFCTECGAALADGAKFCSGCGNKIG